MLRSRFSELLQVQWCHKPKRGVKISQCGCRQCNGTEQSLWNYGTIFISDWNGTKQAPSSFMWNWNFHKFCPESISDGTWFVPFQSKMKPVPWFQKNCLVPLHHWLPYWLILPPPLGLCHHWTSNRFLVSGLQHNYPKKVEKLWKFYKFIKILLIMKYL